MMAGWKVCSFDGSLVGWLCIGMDCCLDGLWSDSSVFGLLDGLCLMCIVYWDGWLSGRLCMGMSWMDRVLVRWSVLNRWWQFGWGVDG